MVKTIWYDDAEVPCLLCGNALPFTRFYGVDNKVVDKVCKQCGK